MCCRLRIRRVAKSPCWKEVRPFSPFLLPSTRHLLLLFYLAVNHILHLSKLNESLQGRLTAQEAEIARLRIVGERIALAGTPPPIPPPAPTIEDVVDDLERDKHKHEQGQAQPHGKEEDGAVKEEYVDVGIAGHGHGPGHEAVGEEAEDDDVFA